MASNAEPPKDRPFTIVVADDDPVIRQILTACLEHEGWKVIAAEDGAEALEALDHHQVDLMLLDVLMPKLGGIQVLEAVRATQTARELPIIMATAIHDSEGVVRALDLGANDYVTKPFDLPVVSARVRSHLRSRVPHGESPVPLGPLNTLAPGTVIDHRYRIEEEIGAGAFSVVFRAVHLTLDLPVALKVLRTGLGAGPEQLERFRREGIMTGRLRHPNAVTVLDFGITASGLAFLAMELLQGESLACLLRREGALPAERCVEILRPVCEVLAHAHAQRIIHRDIKPANIYLHEEAGGMVVKVFDFGLVKLIGDTAQNRQITQQGNVLGTLVYMAPELFEGAPASEASDVYGLGVTLFEALVGRPPFGGADISPLGMAMLHSTREPRIPKEVAEALPADLEALVQKTLAKSPGDRPSAEQCARRLGALVPA